jgi:hypothetical protein
MPTFCNEKSWLSSLRYSTFFETIRIVELVIQTHFENLNHIYMKDSFEVCCEKILE